MQTAQAQVSLRIQGIWSGLFLSDSIYSWLSLSLILITQTIAYLKLNKGNIGSSCYKLLKFPAP